MKNMNTSQPMEQAPHDTNHTKPRGGIKSLYSPYAFVQHRHELEQEAKRLNTLPAAEHNTKIITQWRKQRIFLISERLKELNRRRQ
jgi:hypothetical protein